MPDPRPRACVHGRPAHARHPQQHDGADRPRDQRRRPRGQYPRQLHGQDLNRDHSLLRQPETFALAAMVRDYTPEVAYDGHEFGNSHAGDLPTLWPRHLNVAESIMGESKSLIENWLYTNGSEDGWWYCPYGCQNGGAVGLSQETILRNTMGLKNTVSMLLEARSAGARRARTRLSRRTTAGARRTRRCTRCSSCSTTTGRSSRWSRRTIEASTEFQKSNTGRIVFRGQLRRPGVPRPASGRGAAAGRAAGGHPRPAAVRLPADRRAARLAAGRQPLRGRPPGGPRHQGAAAPAGQLVRADEAGAAGSDPAAARRGGGRADGGGYTDHVLSRARPTSVTRAIPGSPVPPPVV